MATGLQPAVGYVRVSDVGGREGESFGSPDVQEEINARVARERGYRIVATFTDLDETGGALDRPGLEKARAMLDPEDGRAVALIAAYQSRVARNARELLNLCAELEANGRAIEVGDVEPISGPNGKMMRTLIAGIDENRKDVQREAYATARRRAVERGVWIPPDAPIGYLFIGATKANRRGNGRLRIDNKLAPIVRELYRMRGGTASLRECQEYLYKRTGLNLTPSEMSRLFARKVYLGVSKHGDYENPSAHDPIVTQDEFDAANGRKRSGVRRSGTRSLLAGIARCATCGRKMTSTMSGTQGTRVRIYRCPGTSVHGLAPCPERVTIVAATLDAYVIEEVQRWAEGEGFLPERMIETRPSDDAISLRREELREAERERDAYAVETAGMGIPASTIALGLAARQTAVDAAREAVEAAEEADVAAVTRTTLRALRASITVAEHRLLLASVLDRVMVSRGRGLPIEDRAEIVWK